MGQMFDKLQIMQFNYLEITHEPTSSSSVQSGEWKHQYNM